MVNNGTGVGTHTGLMGNAWHRVIFAPASTLRDAKLSESGGVLYGITPAIEDFYTRAHAHETHHVVIQKIEVSSEVVELALKKVLSHFVLMDAQCSYRTSQVLQCLPGFEELPVT